MAPMAQQTSPCRVGFVTAGPMRQSRDARSVSAVLCRKALLASVAHDEVQRGASIRRHAGETDVRRCRSTGELGSELAETLVRERERHLLYALKVEHHVRGTINQVNELVSNGGAVVSSEENGAPRGNIDRQYGLPPESVLEADESIVILRN